MHHLLATTEAFLNDRSMRLNCTKCFNLSLVPSLRDRIMITSTNTNFFINHIAIKTCGYSNCLKYLGIKFNPSGKIGACSDHLKTMLGKIAAAPLKPNQKVFLATTFAIPKMMHQLILGRITKGLLNQFDSVIRLLVKSTLHLPSDTANSFLYTKPKFGGLGIVDLSNTIPKVFLRRLRRMRGSTDPFNVAITNSPVIQFSLNTCNNILGPLIHTPNVDIAITNQHRDNLYLTVDGKGLAQAKVHYQRQNWIRGATNLMSPPNFIKRHQSTH